MLTVFASALLLLALAWGAYWLWRRGVDRDVAEGGRAEHARLAELDARGAAARAEAARLTGLPEADAVAALFALRRGVLKVLNAEGFKAQLARVPDREALLGLAASDEAGAVGTDEALARRAERLTGLRREEAAALLAELHKAARGAKAPRAALAERAPGADRDASLALAMGRQLDLARQSPLLEGTDEAAFTKAYARVETPRFPAYALVAVTAFVLGTPVMLGVLGAVSSLFGAPDTGQAAMALQLGEGGTANVARRVSTEELQHVLEGWSGFYYFFGFLAFWILILVAVMRRYHARTPGLLREEVSRSR